MLPFVAVLALLGPGAAVASAQDIEIPFNPSEYPDPYDPGVPDIPAPAPKPAPKPRPLLPVVPLPATKTIPGTRAYIRADGRAAIPRGAPQRVRLAIAAANQIIGMPYKWGGGHTRTGDRGYDCSGAVGYSLIGGGLLGTTMVSGQLARWAAPGAGRWISVYANRRHVYMEIAGLRLDTSSIGDPMRRSGVRWRPVIGRRAGFHARHPAGL